MARDLAAILSAFGGTHLIAELSEQAPVGILVMEPGGVILYANEPFCAMTRYSRDALGARTLSELAAGASLREAVRQSLAEVCATGEVRTQRSRLSCRDGSEISVSMQLALLAGDAGRGVVAFVQDLTQQEQQAYLLHAIATHDDLTGLPNRTQLQLALARQREVSSQGAVLLIDLRRFRQVNETLGHDFGDLLLVAVSARIRELLPADAALIRFSGDVLVALVSGVTCAEGLALAESLILAMKDPIHINDWEYLACLSIGIALVPSDGDDVIQLVRKADLALGWAKSSAGSDYALYDADIAARAQRRQRLLGLLRKAIERAEFRLHYQPRVDIASGRVTGFEALLRWSSEAAGDIGPAEFIPVAEESGLILEIGEWVLGEAIAQQGRWKRQGIAPEVMAVNLSPRQLRAADLVERIGRLLSEHAVQPEELELEITETALMEDVPTALRLLTDLSQLGVKIGVDDFGTGYSSLAYLSVFPLHRLKIDRSFVQMLGTGGQQDTITQAIILLAHSLHLSVVAEGVETEAQLDFLHRNRCEEFQGFLFSRALPAADCEHLLARQPSARRPARG